MAAAFRMIVRKQCAPPGRFVAALPEFYFRRRAAAFDAAQIPLLSCPPPEATQRRAFGGRAPHSDVIEMEHP